jgi:chaperonin cofactor prefoldin
MKYSSTSRVNSKWMLSLSHDVKSRETVAFYEATKGGESPLILQHLKSCAPQIGNPFLSPILILQESIDTIEKRQRTIREDFRRLEAALSTYLRATSPASHLPLTSENADVDFVYLSKAISNTSTQFELSKESLSVYLAIMNNLETEMRSYEATIPNKGGDPDQVHAELMSRLRFQQKRVQVIEQLHQSTASRLNIQASTVSTCLEHFELCSDH